MKQYIKIFLFSLFLSLWTSQLSFCMEQQSNVQYQTYSSLFYNTLTSKYFMAAVFLYGISHFSPFSSIKNSWNYTWSRLFRSSPPSKNKSPVPTVITTISGNTFDGNINCTEYSDKSGFSTVTWNGITYEGMGSTSIKNGKVYIGGVLQNDPTKTINGSRILIDKKILISPFDTVRCCMGNVIFNHTDTQDNLSIKGEDNILDNLSIQVNNNTLSIAPKEGFSLSPTIKPSLIINLGLASKKKITVSGHSLFEFGTVNADSFDLTAHNSALIANSTFNLKNLGNLNFSNCSQGTVYGKMTNLSITASGTSKFTFEGEVSKNIETDLKGISNGKIENKSNFDTFTTNMNGTSSLDVTGKTKTQKITLNGISKYFGKRLQSVDTTCYIHSCSAAEVYASKTIQGHVQDISRITYYGSPDTTNLSKDNFCSTITKGQ